MDFSYSEEQELIRRKVREFCGEQISPRIAEIDETGEIPRDIIDEMGSKGLFGLTLSREYGGSSSGFMKAAIAAEELGRADISMAVAVYFVVTAGWSFILDRYGTDQAKGELLPAVAAGRSFLGIASTEASGGSDIASTSTTLVKTDKGMVIHGTKTYISGVSEAAKYGGGYVTVVSTDPGQRHRGISLCYLPVRGQAGVSVISQRQMGREGISNGFIKMESAVVPHHYLIGEWNRGFYYAMEGFNCARTLVAAACIGAADGVLEAGISHLKRRKVFNTPLAGFEGIRFQLADSHLRLETARLLVQKAAWMLDTMYAGGGVSRGDVTRTVAAAKIAAPTAAFEIIRDVMMWHGARGYSRAAGLERGLRGVASYLMGAEGAQNIMKVIIARELLGREYI
jgi:acyl-CoA dehydrogenase